MAGRRTPDVLITDVRMPKVDGPALARALAHKGGRMLTIVISAPTTIRGSAHSAARSTPPTPRKGRSCGPTSRWRSRRRFPPSRARAIEPAAAPAAGEPIHPAIARPAPSRVTPALYRRAKSGREHVPFLGSEHALDFCCDSSSATASTSPEHARAPGCRCAGPRLRRQDPWAPPAAVHSALMPASLTTFCQVARSRTRKSANCCGVPPRITTPCFAASSTRRGCCTISLMAAL